MGSARTQSVEGKEEGRERRARVALKVFGRREHPRVARVIARVYARVTRRLDLRKGKTTDALTHDTGLMIIPASLQPRGHGGTIKGGAARRVCETRRRG